MGKNRSEIALLQAGGSVSGKFSHRREHSQPIIFAGLVRPINALQLVADSFTQRNFVSDFLKRSAILVGK